MLRKLLAASLTGLALARDLPLPDKANTASLVAPTRYIVEFSAAGSSKFRKRDGSQACFPSPFSFSWLS
jgi:hypothetical protein